MKLAKKSTKFVLSKRALLMACLWLTGTQSVLASNFTTGNTVFKAPTGLWIANPQSPSTPYGATSVGLANWTLQQLNIPKNLPPFTFVNGAFRTTNEYDEAIFSPPRFPSGGAPVSQSVSPLPPPNNSSSLTVIQNGLNVPYELKYPSGLVGPLENNLGMSPNKISFQGSPVAAVDITADLGSLEHIYQSLTIEPGQVQILDMQQPATPTTVTQASYYFAVVLTNQAKKGNFQTLFYQVMLGHFHVQGNSQTGTVINKMPQGFWFCTGVNPQFPPPYLAKTYGYTDVIDSFNLPDASSTAKITYPKKTNLWAVCQPAASITYTNVDLLPQIKTIIADGAQYGVDQTLSDWKLTGAYLGQAIWGHVNAKSTWSDFALTVQ